jgi:hypothetical protein
MRMKKDEPPDGDEKKGGKDVIGEDKATKPGLRDLLARAGDVAGVFRVLEKQFIPGRIGEEIVYCFSVNEEVWTLTVGPEVCKVQNDQCTEEADCFLKMSRDIFLGTLRGEYTPSVADLMSGRIKSRRPELLRFLTQVFDDGRILTSPAGGPPVLTKANNDEPIRG